jgi:hypothetical protein
MKEHHFRPWEINELTMTEIAVLLLAHKENKEDVTELSAGASKQMREAFMRKQERHMAKMKAKRDAWDALPTEEKINRLKQRYPE